MATEQMDALVIFGATGDLAKLETFPALVGLVDRGVLDVPVIGVAKSGWGLDAVPRLRRGVAAAQRHGPGQPGRGEDARAAALRRRRPRRRGDLRRDVGRDGRRARGRCSTWRCRRRCSGASPRASRAAGRAEAPGSWWRSRSAPTWHSAQELNDDDARRSSPRTPSTGSTTGSGSTRWRTSCSRGSPTRSSSRCSTAPTSRASRSRWRRRSTSPTAASFYDRTGAIRDVVQNHLLQVLASVLADPPGRARAATPGWTAKAQLIDALRPLDAGHDRRGPVRGLPRRRRRRARARRPRRYVAVRLAVDSWRWADVPIVIRAGKCMPVTATEVTIRFRPAAARHVRRCEPSAATNALRFRIWPESQDRAHAGRQEAGRRLGARGRRTSSFAEHPGSDMRPYDRLIGAALDGDGWLFARQDTVEAAWRVVDPVLVPGRGARHPYAPGSWGPKEADARAAGRRPLARPGRVSQTWKAPDMTENPNGAAPRTSAAIADHGLIGDLQTAALVTHRRLDRLVLLPAVRLAQRVRRPARRRAGRPLPDPPGRDRRTRPSRCTSRTPPSWSPGSSPRTASARSSTSCRPPARTRHRQPPAGADGAVRPRPDDLRRSTSPRGSTTAGSRTETEMTEHGAVFAAERAAR